ncbi:MAG TPA: M14 family zinc carboxypeptidase [Bacillota bacterium]|nr:M14 family zinc carboxypeptidase [Bacillota bacterium]
MKNLQAILDRVPSYDCFFTVAEMEERSCKVKKQFPAEVDLFNIGVSREGRDINCLKIGHGRVPVLLIGCPHPNEPIGAMTLDALISELLTHGDLAGAFDCTWYMIKSSDIDATVMNEGWFKGPFTITHYMENFFRPAFHQQVEWSFPVMYKDYSFHSPIPETQAIMRLMDKVPFRFIYSLHNAGFGGCYWYVTGGEEILFKKLYLQPEREEIPLHLGEPETPYCKELYPAVYKDFGLRAQYDYLEKHMEDFDPSKHLSAGASCVEYINNHSSDLVYSLVNELPYFYDPRVEDQSLSEYSRKEVLLKACALADQTQQLLMDLYHRVRAFIDRKNPYILAVEDRLRLLSGTPAKRRWIEGNEAFLKPAKICQAFDNLYISRFYNNLNFTLLAQGLTHFLESGEGFEVTKRAVLAETRDRAKEIMEKNNRFLEENLNYHSIPIEKLVRVQMASCFHYLDYVLGKCL